MQPVNQELVVLMAAYVEGTIDLASLKEWLASNVWDISSSPSPLDRMLLGELERVLAEFDRGDRTEEEVHDWVWELLQLPNPTLMPEEAIVA